MDNSVENNHEQIIRGLRSCCNAETEPDQQPAVAITCNSDLSPDPFATAIAVLDTWFGIPFHA